MQVLKSEKGRRIFTVIFVVVLTIIPLSLCFNQNVWLDEAFSLRWSMWPFPDFFRRITLDVCPLYLILLRIVLTVTNNSLLAAKLFSVLGVFLLFLIGVYFVRKEFGYKAMVFYCLFILFTPMTLKKAVEVRMYTLAFLGVTCSSVQMYHLLKKSANRKNWILFTVSSLAAAYTHYFSVLSLIVLYAGLLIFYLFTRNWKQVIAWLICSACTAIGYLPWVPVVIRQSNSETTSWITMSTSRLGVMRDVFQTHIPKLENVYILMLIVLLIVGFILFCKLKTVELYWSLVCMSTVWVVLIFGLIWQSLMRPILVDRYLMIPLCISIMGMSYIWKYISKYALLLPCILFLITGMGTYPKVFEEEYNPITKETLAFAQAHIQDADIILHDADSLSSVVPYFFPERVELDGDIYAGNYSYLWYFDTYQTLDLERLTKNNIAYEYYGEYGFDNVPFAIYYIYPLSEEGISN